MQAPAATAMRTDLSTVIGTNDPTIWLAGCPETLQSSFLGFALWVGSRLGFGIGLRNGRSLNPKPKALLKPKAQGPKPISVRCRRGTRGCRAPVGRRRLA